MTACIFISFYFYYILTGLTIHDMGIKMGLNGIDNAKISFDNVRVPRENLLNKESEVKLKLQKEILKLVFLGDS